MFRLCVRSVTRPTTFSLVPALPSRSSADGSPPLFGPFTGTTARSDSSTTYAWGVRLAPSPTGPLFAAGVAEVSRFSCEEFPDVHGFPRPRRARLPLALTRQSMWPSPSVHRVGARKEVFRGSIIGPPVPLSTLHPRCRHRRRMTRGQRGSLDFRCGALSSPTPRRFIPALSDSASSNTRSWPSTLFAG